jgi:hypothetical protein
VVPTISIVSADDNGPLEVVLEPAPNVGATMDA